MISTAPRIGFDMLALRTKAAGILCTLSGDTAVLLLLRMRKKGPSLTLLPLTENTTREQDKFLMFCRFLRSPSTKQRPNSQPITVLSQFSFLHK